MFTVKTQAGSATSEYRYYLVGFIPLIIAMVEHFYSIWKQDKIDNRRAYSSFMVFMAIGMVSLSSYLLFMMQEDSASNLKEIVSYCKEAEFDVVYLYDGSNDSDVMRAIDQEREYICLLETGQTYAADYYERYSFGGVQKEKTVVIVDNELYDFGDEFMILDMALTKVDEVANRKVYIFN